MLTGTTAAGEQAVWGAIDTLGSGVAVDELLVVTAKCAIEIPDGCLPVSLPERSLRFGRHPVSGSRRRSSVA
jgi:hypothetical protein